MIIKKATIISIRIIEREESRVNAKDKNNAIKSPITIRMFIFGM